MRLKTHYLLFLSALSVIVKAGSFVDVKLQFAVSYMITLDALCVVAGTWMV